MEMALANLNKGSSALDNAYNDVLHRIEHQLEGWQSLARKVLLWITHAKKELTIEELQEAIAVEPGCEDIDHDKDVTDEDLIVSVCHGLVEVDQESRVVRLVHYTTQGYFEKVRNKWLPAGDVDITRSCLAYLKMTVLDHDRSYRYGHLSTLVRKHKLLLYSAIHWGCHARMVNDCQLQTEIASFLLDPEYLRFSSQVIHPSFNFLTRQYFFPLTGLSAAYVCAKFGLVRILQGLIERGENVDVVDHKRMTPLLRAAKEGQTRIVQLLLAQPDVDIEAEDNTGRTALFHAAVNGHTETVQQLLTRPDVDVNKYDQWGQSILFIAAENGHTEVTRQLLAQSHIKVNEKDREGRTALLFAAGDGHIEFVRQLLARSDVKVNEDNRWGRTALLFAAENGHTEIVQLLLAQPNMGINVADICGRTALSLAAGNGHTETVQLLLTQPNVDINAAEIYGRTALSYAAEIGATEIVRKLLARPDVDINAECVYDHTKIMHPILAPSPMIINEEDEKEGRTALSFAARNGHTEIVQLLLARSEIKINKEDQEE